MCKCSCSHACAKFNLTNYFRRNVARNGKNLKNQPEKFANRDFLKIIIRKYYFKLGIQGKNHNFSICNFEFRFKWFVSLMPWYPVSNPSLAIYRYSLLIGNGFLGTNNRQTSRNTNIRRIQENKEVVKKARKKGTKI